MVDKNTKENITLIEWMAGHPGTYTANVLSAVQSNQKQWGKKGKAKEPGKYTSTIQKAIMGRKNKWYGMNSSGVPGVEGAEEEEAPGRVGVQTKPAPQQIYSTGSDQAVKGGSGKNKIDQAKTLFQALVAKPGFLRKDVIEAFVQQLGVTESTAVSYYERLAKEAGLTKEKKGEDESEMQAGGGGEDETAMQPAVQPQPEEEMPEEPEDDPSGDKNRAGTIRYVKDAHLIYKRRNEEGTFDELWLYNISNDMKDELTVRRAILAGTDISKNKTKSEDGNQNYSLSTLGNAQYLHITGLPN